MQTFNIDTILGNFEYNGYFLDKSDLNALLNDVKFSNFDELLSYLNDEDGNYISDLLNELSDSRVDIYYPSLRLWTVDNYGYIEDAVNEFGMNEFDFHKAIQLGQYKAYLEEFDTLISEFRDYIEELQNDTDMEDTDEN